MKKIFLFAFSLFCSVFVFGQYGFIKGKVETTDHEAAAYVSLTLNPGNLGVMSGDDGSFSIRANAGQYTLIVSYTGLQTVKMNVVVQANKTTAVNLLLRENLEQLKEVVIENHPGLNDKPVSIGKMEIDPMNLPQSIAVVGQKIIRDQQAQRLSDVIKNVNGIYLSSTRGSTQENFSARGYAFSSSNLFKDGSRINSGTMPEVSSLEKLEVLKGSAAILYGNVAPGGIINMVTKQPKFSKGAEISIRAGSFGLYKPSFDVYGPLSAKIAYRVDSSYENEKTFRDVVHSKRYYINPSLLFKLSNRTRLLLQTDFLKHDFTPDFGIGTYDNTKIPDVPRSRFYGANWQYAHTKQISATAHITHQIKDGWSLTGLLSYQQYDRDYFSTERIQALANGDWARPLNKTKNYERYFTGQINLDGSFQTGKIQHHLLAGIDADHYDIQATSYNQPAIYDTINIFDVNKFQPRTDIPVTNAIRLVSTPSNRAGIYVQDLISISKKLKLLGGIRWSYQFAQAVDTINFATDTHAKALGGKVDKAFSPRLGIVYKPTETTSLFASYANSFSVNSGTDVYGHALSPSIIDQYEAGIKNEILKGVISANLTIYRIINNNLAQTALFAADGITSNSNTNLKALTGQTTSDGVEIDLSIHPLIGMEVLAGYSYNYIRYTKTPDAKGNFIEGERLINNPASTANASLFYTVRKGSMKGLKTGASFYYTGKRFAGFNNTKGQTQTYLRNFEVKGFSTVDLDLGYAFKKLSIMLKISNLGNSYNYYVHENYSVNPIAPRQVIATLSYKF